MIFFHILTLFFFLIQIVFVFSRLFLSRDPQDILSWTGYLCLIYLIYFIVFLVFIVYRYYFPLKKPKSFKKFFIKIKFKIIDYFDIEFTQGFLRGIPQVNYFFYKNMLFFEKNLKNLTFFLKLFYVYPYMLFLISLLFEFFTRETFWLTLYALTFWLITRKTLQLLIWFAYHKHCALIRYINVTRFKPFFHRTFQFFINNRLFITSMFFSEPRIANKRMLKFLWETYSEINHYLKCCAYMNFFFERRKLIEKFLIDINKIIFGLVFISVSVVKFSDVVNLRSSEDFFFALLWGSGIFLIFLLWLNFYGKYITIKIGPFCNEIDFDESQQSWTFEIVQELVQSHKFLEKADLIFFKNQKTAQDFIWQEGHSFKNFFTDEENQVWLEILERYENFYLEEANAKTIDVIRHTFDGEAYNANFDKKNQKNS